MSKIEIGAYKNQTIYYDEHSDKFMCDISIEDRAKSTKRGSLSDLKKEIDQFIKLNLDFKPFKAIRVDYNDVTVVTVEGIRVDGTFIVNFGSSYKSFWTKEDCNKKLRSFSQELIQQRESLRKEFEAFKKGHDVRLTCLLDSLQPIDLSKYDVF